MIKSDLINSLNSYDKILKLIINEPNIYDKLKDEFKLKSIKQAKKDLLSSTDFEKSFIEFPNPYIESISFGLYDNSDIIMTWLNNSNNFLVINPSSAYYSEHALKTMQRVGYNFRKVSLPNNTLEIETRDLLGLEITLEKDGNNILITNIIPNNHMIGSFVLPDDQEKSISEPVKENLEKLAEIKAINKSLDEIDSDESVDFDNDFIEFDD